MEAKTKRHTESKLDRKFYKLIKKATDDGLRKEALAIITYIEQHMPHLFVHPREKYGQSKLDKIKLTFCGNQGDLFLFLQVYQAWSEVAKRERPLWCSNRCIDHHLLLMLEREINKLQTALAFTCAKKVHPFLPWKDAKKVLINLLITLFPEDLCVYSGHDKLGYMNIKTNQQIRLWQDSCVFINDTVPKIVLIPGVSTKTMYGSFVGSSSGVCVTDTILEKYKDNLYVKKTLDIQKSGNILKCTSIGPIGAAVLEVLYERGYATIIEDKIIRKVENPFVKLEKEHHKDEFILICPEQFVKVAQSLTHREIRKVSKTLSSEGFERKILDGPSLNIAHGGSVKNITEFWKISSIVVYPLEIVRNNDMQSKVEEVFTRYGVISQISKAPHHADVITDAWGTVTFKEPYSVQKVFCDKANLAESYRFHIEKYCDKEAILSDPNGKHKIVCNMKRRCRDGRIVVTFESRHECNRVLDDGGRSMRNIPEFEYADFRRDYTNPYKLTLRVLEPNLTEKEVIAILEHTYHTRIVSIDFLLENQKKIDHLYHSEVVSNWKDNTFFSFEVAQLEKDYTVEVLSCTREAIWSRFYLLPKDEHTAEKILQKIPFMLDGSEPMREINYQHTIITTYFIQKQINEVLFCYGKSLDGYVEKAQKIDSNFKVVYRETIEDDIIQINIYWQKQKAFAQFKEFFELSLVPILHSCTLEESLYLVKRLPQMFPDQISVEREVDMSKCGSVQLKIYTNGKTKYLVQQMLEQHNNDVKSKTCTTSLSKKEVYDLVNLGSFSCLQELYGLEFLDIDFSGQKKPCLIMHGSEEAMQKLVHQLQLKSKDEKSDESHDNDKMCVTCFGKMKTCDIVRLSLCGHSYCKDCFTLLCKVGVEKKDFPLKCVDKDCEVAISVQDIESVQDKNSFDMNALLKKSLDQFVLCNKNVKYCKTPGCEYVFFAKELKNISSKHECPGCKASICVTCFEPYHKGLSCNVHRRLNALKTEETKLSQWILESPRNRKMCPNCESGIEKNAGCNNIHCVACNKSICWLCLCFFSSSFECYNHMEEAHTTEDILEEEELDINDYEENYERDDYGVDDYRDDDYGVEDYGDVDSAVGSWNMDALDDNFIDIDVYAHYDSPYYSPLYTYSPPPLPFY